MSTRRHCATFNLVSSKISPDLDPIQRWCSPNRRRRHSRTRVRVTSTPTLVLPYRLSLPAHPYRKTDPVIPSPSIPAYPSSPPDTPEASHSVSTSPTSSVSPQTPPDAHGSGFGPSGHVRAPRDQPDGARDVFLPGVAAQCRRVDIARLSISRPARFRRPWTLSSDGAPPTGTGTIHAPECESRQLQHWFFHTGFRSPRIPTARWTCHSESFDPRKARIPSSPPDTPEASHSVLTSPTSSVSPQIPPDAHGSGFGPNVVSAKSSPLGVPAIRSFLTATAPAKPKGFPL
jgi:hypothetical protein